MAGVDGAEVVEAANPKEAIELSRAFQPDIALVDYEMTPMDGVAFTRLVRSDATPFPRNLPIVMMTGHADQAHVMQARDAGVNGFIAKPLSVGMVIRQIERTMASISPSAAAPPRSANSTWT